MSRGAGNHSAPLIYEGAWTATRTYQPRHVVTHGGQVYMALTRSLAVEPLSISEPVDWLNLGGLSFVDLWHRDRFELAASGAQVLTFTWQPKATPLFVFLNGIYQEEGADFTVAGSGLYVDADMGAEIGDVLEVRYLIGGEGTTVNPMSLAILTDIPALYWTLGDDVGSTTVLDASGNGRHGHIGGGYDPIDFGFDSLIPGTPETCAYITWDRVIRDHEVWMNFGSAFALEVILKTADMGGGMVWAHDDWGTGQRAFYLRTNPSDGLLSFHRAGDTTILTSGAVVVDNVPHHVVANYDGTTLEFWIDGVLDSSVAMSSPPSASTPLWLGGYYATGWGTDNVNDFVGYMQHAVVYTHALSAARIAAHAAAAGF